MSLINDALKKRRDAEDQQPPVRGDLTLQPVDLDSDPAAGDVASRAKRFWLIAVIIVVVVNLGLFLWYAQKKAVAARTLAAEEAVKAEEAARIEAEQLQLKAEQAAAAAVASNAAFAQAERERIRSQRPAFRLQGIMYHPSRPSAIVNNRAVSIGDRVDGYRVIAINRNQATLATDRDEVTLTLP